MNSLSRVQNITIVMVTHEPDMAAYAKRINRFVDGRIESDAPQPTGGVIGIVLGLAVLGTRALEVPFTFDWMIVLIAFAFSAVVGVLMDWIEERGE